MDEERFQTDVRRFLKKFGVTSQREIEDAVRQAVESGALVGDERLRVEAIVTIQGVPEPIVVDGEIALEN
ncbi:MAG TPA: DUF6494 family protein [Longimicrobiales bacterium]|nr:DUF6494 family protein [Longimicrobiales bacterium]